MPHRTALALFLVLAAACDADVSLGASCAYDSECAAGLACRFGRCRAECLSARDCDEGLECVVGAAGGACSVPQDRGCTVAGCSDGLVCDDDVCRQPCTERACASEMQCVDQVCVRAAPSDGGTCAAAPCDPVRDCGCASGQRCAVVSGAPACVGAGGSASAGDACADAAECAAGLGCHQGLCYEYCSEHEDCSTAGTWCESEAPPGVRDLGDARACSQACDALTGEGCPEGTCALGVGAEGLVSWCATVGSIAIGETCSATYECVPRSFCEGSTLGGSDRACRAVCTDFGTSCPSGGTCVEVGTLRGTAVGLCLPG